MRSTFSYSFYFIRIKVLISKLNSFLISSSRCHAKKKNTRTFHSHDKEEKQKKKGSIYLFYYLLTHIHKKKGIPLFFLVVFILVCLYIHSEYFSIKYMSRSYWDTPLLPFINMDHVQLKRSRSNDALDRSFKRSKPYPTDSPK